MSTAKRRKLKKTVIGWLCIAALAANMTVPCAPLHEFAPITASAEVPSEFQDAATVNLSELDQIVSSGTEYDGLTVSLKKHEVNGVSKDYYEIKITKDSRYVFTGSNMINGKYVDVQFAAVPDSTFIFPEIYFDNVYIRNNDGSVSENNELQEYIALFNVNSNAYVTLSGNINFETYSANTAEGFKAANFKTGEDNFGGQSICSVKYIDENGNQFKEIYCTAGSDVNLPEDYECVSSYGEYITSDTTITVIKNHVYENGSYGICQHCHKYKPKEIPEEYKDAEVVNLSQIFDSAIPYKGIYVSNYNDSSSIIITENGKYVFSGSNYINDSYVDIQITLAEGVEADIYFDDVYIRNDNGNIGYSSGDSDSYIYGFVSPFKIMSNAAANVSGKLCIDTYSRTDGIFQVGDLKTGEGTLTGMLTLKYFDASGEPVEELYCTSGADVTNPSGFECFTAKGSGFDGKNVTENTTVTAYVNHSFGTNGICSYCGECVPAGMISDKSSPYYGYYEIANAGNLYWFAQQVNIGNTEINAVLTKDITVNSNLLSSLEYDAEGNVTNGENFTSWTPIGNGSNKYNGTFEGQGFTVSGLYFNDESKDFVGLFGYILSGRISNVGVVDSYFKGNQFIGGVCGCNQEGTITNCYNTGTVSGESYVGGVCASNGGLIANCYYLKSTAAGGINGADDIDNNVVGKTAAQFASGEVAFLLSQGCKFGDTTYDGSVWGQTIGKENYPVSGGKKVISNIDQSAFANDIIIYGQNVTLDGTIGFNIYVYADENYDWDKTINGIKGQEIEKGLYKFTYQIAAKDMDNEIDIIIGGKKAATVSVSDYLNSLDTADNAILAALAEAMKAYGIAADAFFAPDGIVPEISDFDVSALDAYGFTKGETPEGISYYGSSLILESETTVRHYFRLAEGYDINNFTFTVGVEEVTPVAKQGYYYIDIKNISADKLGTAHTVSIGGTPVISGYSALSYAKTVLNSDAADENLKNLVKALYLYNRAAVEYNVKTGWVQDGENWYYYDDNGIMQTGWATGITGYDDAWFYFGNDGIMQTGWVTNIPGFDGAWFYFGDDGIMQTSRWVLDGGNWYYLNDDGTLLMNGYTPDGYYVDENGIRTGM
ncbi:MAG: GLUG motif-containing protein [Ruminococcus sp.]